MVDYAFGTIRENFLWCAAIELSAGGGDPCRQGDRTAWEGSLKLVQGRDDANCVVGHELPSRKPPLTAAEMRRESAKRRNPAKRVQAPDRISIIKLNAAEPAVTNGSTW